jgi:hypothetical protein
MATFSVKIGILNCNRTYGKVYGILFALVYIGFNTPLHKYGVRQYSTAVCDPSCTSQTDLHHNFTGDFATRNLIFVDYGQVDSKLAPAGKTVGSICTSDYLSEWENVSDEDYTAKKQAIGALLIDRVNAIYPGLKEAVECYEVGTAKTINRYTLNPGGRVYGFTQITGQAGKNRVAQQSLIENLYFASAWIEPGGGFGAALGSEYMVATKILKQDKR